MFEEIEGGSISPFNKHEVDSSASVFHQEGRIIMLAFLNVCQSNRPREDAELKSQGLSGDAYG